MAKLQIDAIYSDAMEIMLSSERSFNQLQERFLHSIYTEVTSLAIKGLEAYAISESFGGFISKKEEILIITYKKGKVKGLYGAFLAQSQGTSTTFRLYKCIDPALAQLANAKPQAQRIETIKLQLESFAARHEFTFLDALLERLYTNGLKRVKSL